MKLYIGVFFSKIFRKN